MVRAEFLGGVEHLAPRLEIKEIAGASHFLPEEKPAEVASALLDFFRD